MLGYSCPCCANHISIAEVGERRRCPTCKASVETQGIVTLLRRKVAQP